jgi:uncharacterized protein (DUF2249 family)
MNDDTITLDVRAEIRAGVEPLSKILKTVGTLRDEQHLRVIAPFKPVPLFALLGRKGFNHRELPLGDGEWEVIFSRTPRTADTVPSIEANVLSAAVSSSEMAPEPVVIDARGLEPPQPLVTILEGLAKLPAHGIMQAHTDRRPMHLYSHLAERGYVGESEEQPDGSFITHIRRA